MSRDITAYFSDIIAACDYSASALSDISTGAYAASRENRSTTERGFIVIGEAISMPAKFAPESFERLSDGRKAIGLRHILTYGYASVDHETVYGIALEDDPSL